MHFLLLVIHPKSWHWCGGEFRIHLPSHSQCEVSKPNYSHCSSLDCLDHKINNTHHIKYKTLVWDWWSKKINLCMGVPLDWSNFSDTIAKRKTPLFGSQYIIIWNQNRINQKEQEAKFLEYCGSWVTQWFNCSIHERRVGQIYQLQSEKKAEQINPPCFTNNNVLGEPCVFSYTAYSDCFTIQ